MGNFKEDMVVITQATGYAQVATSASDNTVMMSLL